MSIRTYGSSPKTPALRTGSSALLYARVSSKEQEEGYSLDAQLKALRAYCASKNLSVLQEFVEAETAKASGRPAFNEMIRLAAQGSISAIVVEKTDRIYRNLKDRVLVDELGVDLHLVKEGEVIGKDSKSHAKFIHDIKLVVAKNYCDNLSEETRKGMLEKARQGIWPTKAPLGYLNVERSGKRIIESDPQRAELVRQLFHEYASDRTSLKGLIRFADQIGLRTRMGHRLVKSHLAKLLRNSAYCGLVAWGGDVVAGRHEAIISRETFDRVQRLLDGRAKNNAGFGSKTFAYRGLLVCGYCGCTLTAELKKGRYIYYHCTGNHGPCPKPFVREERLTDEFAAVLDRIHIPPEVVEWISEELTKEHHGHKQRESARIDRLRKEEARLLKRLESLYIDKVEGDLALETYRSIKGKADEELACVRSSMSAGSAPGEQRTDPLALIELAATASNRFKNADPDLKRELIASVCSNSTYTSDGVQVSLLKPFDIFASSAMSAQLSGDLGADSGVWLPQ